MSTEATRERRRAPRASYQNPIMLRTGLGEVLRAESRDVSELGMGLSTQGLDHAAQPLWLTFSLPQVPHVIQLKARVVRRQPEAAKVTLGLRFLDAPQTVRRMLRTFVHTGRGWVKDYDPAVSATLTS